MRQVVPTEMIKNTFSISGEQVYRPAYYNQSGGEPLECSRSPPDHLTGSSEMDKRTNSQNLTHILAILFVDLP